MEQFTTRNGYVKSGVIVRIYQAFEGGTRYIFRTDSGEYRCIKVDVSKMKMVSIGSM